MPRQNAQQTLPKLRHHTHSGRAVVTLNGHHIYLGKHGTPEAEQRYWQVIAEFKATGRVPEPICRRRSRTPTIDDLVLGYWRYCERTYSKATREGSIRPAIKRLRRLYGDLPVDDFTPARLRAPISMVSTPTPFDLLCSSKDVKINGPRVLQPCPDLGIAQCSFTVRTTDPDLSARLTATIEGTDASTDLCAVAPKGTGLSIRIEDIDLGNDRYRYKGNVIEIAARHPALKRYLGPKTRQFPGQESLHFRVLLAEIVADAVCGKVIESRELQGNYADEPVDSQFFAAEHSKLKTEFAPKAHTLIVADSELPSYK